MSVFRIVVGFGVLAGILLFSYHLYKDTVNNYGRVEGDKLAIYLSLGMMVFSTLLAGIAAIMMIRG